MGDIVITANGKELQSTEEFAKIIESSKGDEIEIELIREKEKLG